MRIGILGSGLMGGKLGTIFARAGHDVTFSYARSEQKLKKLAEEARAHCGTREKRRMMRMRAFNTLPSEVLFPIFESKNGERPHVVYYGDDTRAKEAAATLIKDVGFAPLDAGPLRIARYAEPFALLVARLAYEGEAGPQMAYRFRWL